MSHCRLVLVAAVVALVLVATATAADMPDNPCTKGWTGPSTSNDLTCKVILNATKDGIPDFAITTAIKVGAPMLVALLVFLSCPLVFCSRYVCQCCGGWRQRPGSGCCSCSGSEWDDRTDEERQSAYSAYEITTVKVLAFVVALVGAGCVVMAYVGGIRVLDGVNEVITGATGLVRWAVGLLLQVINAIRGPNPSVLPSSIATTFDTFERRLNETNNTVERIQGEVLQHKAIEYFRSGVTAVSYPSMVPAAVFLFGLCTALFNVRTCCPCLLILFSFILVLPFGVMSSVFFAINVPFDVVCAEVAAQTAKQPGYIQWGVVPQCTDANPLRYVDQALNNTIRDIAESGCADLVLMCDPSSVYDAVNAPDKVFRCESPYRVNCTNLVELADFLDSLVLKPDSPYDCGAAVPRWNCSVRNCAQYCTNATFRDNANTAVSGLELIQRADAAARRLLLPWADCNRFVDHVLDGLPLCGSLHQGLRLLAASCVFIELALITAIVVYFLGQKRFFNKKDSPVQGQWRQGDPYDEYGTPMKQREEDAGLV